MVAQIRISGISATDRLGLENELPADQLRIEEPAVSEGVSGIFEPVSATVILSLAALTVIAEIVCRKNSEEVHIERLATETAPAETITIRKTSDSKNCKVHALAQLTKAFANFLSG